MYVNIQSHRRRGAGAADPRAFPGGGAAREGVPRHKHLSGRARASPRSPSSSPSLPPRTARAHCDTSTARGEGREQALRPRDVTPGAHLGQPKERRAPSAFDHALAVRKLGPEAQRLADRFFFETLVRVHRAR